MQAVVTAPRAPRPTTCIVPEVVSAWLSCSRGSEHSTPLVSSAGPAASFGLRWSRCPCRSLRTKSWPRRAVPVPVRSRHLPGFAGRDRFGIRETASAAAHGARLGRSMQGTQVCSTSKVPGCLVTAIAGLPPFPGTVPERRANVQKGARLRGDRPTVFGTVSNSAGRRKARVRAGLDMSTGETHPRAKRPMNRAKTPPKKSRTQDEGGSRVRPAHGGGAEHLGPARRRHAARRAREAVRRGRSASSAAGGLLRGGHRSRPEPLLRHRHPGLHPVLNRDKPVGRKGKVLFIDASGEFGEGINQNRLRESSASPALFVHMPTSTSMRDSSRSRRSNRTLEPEHQPLRGHF